MKSRKFLHPVKTPAAATGGYYWLRKYRNKVSPYDRAFLGTFVGLGTSIYEPSVATGIGIAAFLQLLEVTTAKLIVNDYPGKIYAIGEKGRLIRLLPGQALLTGMDGLAIPGQRTVYKCVDGCYYKVTRNGQIKLTGGIFQGLAHSARGGGHKDLIWCRRQHTLGNPAWLSFYNTANH